VQLTAEKIRLEAERDGAAELHFPSGFAKSDPGAAAAARERRLFETRRAAVRRQKALLAQRIVQVRHEVAGLLMQQRAREQEVQLFREELRLIDDMHGRKLANVARLMGLRRDLARSEGEVGGLVAQVARARAQIEETEMQILEVEQKPVREADKEIRDVDARIDELSGRGPRSQ
jgi:HlyD family secretion protein